MNWKDELNKEVELLGDTIIECSATEEEMAVDFDGGYGRTNGKHFTAWGEKYVYFPICCDGAEWVGHAPRNPCDIAMGHQGG